MHGTHTPPPPPPPTRYASSSIARVERTWQDYELGIFSTTTTTKIIVLLLPDWNFLRKSMRIHYEL
jgi:hypothetical protein